jgi:hypothetical protein
MPHASVICWLLRDGPGTHCTTIHSCRPLIGLGLLLVLGLGCTRPASPPAAAARDAAAGPSATPAVANSLPAAPASHPVAGAAPAPAGGTCRPPPRALGQDWGIPGWTGSGACARGARLWADVPPADRDCQSDADCVLLEAHTCFQLAVASRAAEKYRSAKPCPNPAAGPCARRPMAAACRDGCCGLASPARRPGTAR